MNLGIVAAVVARLREIREERGISQYRLSKETGLSASGIRHMENGRVNPTLYFLLLEFVPSWVLISRICSGLGRGEVEAQIKNGPPLWGTHQPFWL